MVSKSLRRCKSSFLVILSLIKHSNMNSITFIPRVLALCLFFQFLSQMGQCQINDTDTAWNKIKQYFQPPDEHRNETGNYRSPLRFYDGRMVETPEDWAVRRE